MSKALFNAYGAQIIPGETKQRLAYKEEITESTGTTTVYKTYDSSASAAIYKETITEADGVTSITREIAYGAWSDRATLTYVPVNDPLEVG
ncbi:hypothetical protein SDC9_166455 [bioreactor metagenome]|uniref:Uncharacterized protein n=1 Tax=bioreactor metagenome TaxID=1076179 RepID=A0A645FZN0_9ZZZZ